MLHIRKYEEVITSTTFDLCDLTPKDMKIINTALARELYDPREGQRDRERIKELHHNISKVID